MRWRNHKIVTFSAVYSVTGGFVSSFAAMMGSVLPDLLEFRGVIPHRTITHYIWSWLLLCLVLWAVLKSNGDSMLAYSCFFLVCGGLLHVVEDGLSAAGIPYGSPFGLCKGVGIYKTGSLAEEITSFGMVAVFLFFAWLRGCLDAGYLAHQLSVVAGLSRHFFK